jgi:WD40 repeat protein
MASPTAPADRTETMAPRASSPALPRPEPGAGAGAGESAPDATDVDDPERYEEVAEHARGGLGRIVRAVDKRLGRTVAVKELLRRDAGDASEARFLREAMITARLEHPGIVPVHEAGRWPNGDPYYVMKLVEGRTLKELIAEHATLRERLALLPHVIAVADAVGYAHSEGVIHRDLKPSNVVVGAFGETIVVDWGLARDLRQPVSPEAAELESQVVGTPAYMAPEQARGASDTGVDERADVYAIGAVLYELLAGRGPYADTTGTPQEVIDRVLEGPPQSLRAVAHDVPHELAGVVGKAMAREPARRYPHATALAEDLRRFQTGQLVSAHSYTAWQLVRRKLAAHRGVVAVAAASAIALGALGVASFSRVVAERNNANVERGRAEDALTSAEERKHQLVLLQAETALRKDPTAAVAWLKLAVAEPAVSEPERGDMVDLIDESAALGVARHVFRAGDWVFDAQFTPDGATLVAVVRDGGVHAYDLHTGEARVIGHAPPAPETMALSPDGLTVVTGSTDGQVEAWAVAGGEPRKLSGMGRMITSLKFSDDGRRVLATRDGAAPEIFDLDGASVHELAPSNGLYAAVAPGDWSHVVAQVAQNQIAVVAADGTTRPLAKIDKAVWFVAVAPCGDLVLVHDGAQVWQVPYGGGPLRAFAAYDGKLSGAVWSPDAGTVALIGTRPEILLVDVASGATRELRGHTDQIYSAEFTRDGATLLTASDDGTARVWSLADGSSQVLLGHDDDVYRARLSPDERFAVTASLDGSVRVWPITPPDGTRVFHEGGGDVQDLTVDASGESVLVKTATAMSRWNLATGAREALFAWGNDPHGLGIGINSPDGNSVALLAADNTVEVRHRDGTSVTLRGHRGLVTHLEFTRDSSALYSSAFDGTVRRWDIASGTSEIVLSGDGPVRTFAVARDGRVVAQIGDTATLLPADGGAPIVLGSGAAWCSARTMFEPTHDWLVLQRCDSSLAVLEGDRLVALPTSGYEASRVVVSPDGERIAAALNDRTIRIWDAHGALVGVLRGHSDLVMDAAFSPDGRELASASYDQTVRVWDLASGRHRVLRGHTAAVDRIAWPAPAELVTGSRDGTLRVWTVPSLDSPTQGDLATQLAAATSATIDERDRPTTH